MCCTHTRKRLRSSYTRRPRFWANIPNTPVDFFFAISSNARKAQRVHDRTQVDKSIPDSVRMHFNVINNIGALLIFRNSKIIIPDWCPYKNEEGFFVFSHPVLPAPESQVLTLRRRSWIWWASPSSSRSESVLVDGLLQPPAVLEKKNKDSHSFPSRQVLDNPCEMTKPHTDLLAMSLSSSRTARALS